MLLLFFSVSNSLIVTVSHGNCNTVTVLEMINWLGLLFHWLAKFRNTFVLSVSASLLPGVEQMNNE